MELCDKLTKADLYLRIEHRDRTLNVWADQLANRNSTCFNSARRGKPTAPFTMFDVTYRMAKALRLDKPQGLKQKELLRSRREGSQ